MGAIVTENLTSFLSYIEVIAEGTPICRNRIPEVLPAVVDGEVQN
jgi:hypothetical protein